MKPAVAVLLRSYPQTSQTYMEAELRALAEHYRVHVIALQAADAPYRQHLPYEIRPRLADIIARVRELRPRVLHGHWLQMARILQPVSEATGVPWTLRSHSFDVLQKPRARGRWPRWRARLLGRPDPTCSFPELYAPLIREPACLGVLAFPFARLILERAGVPADKLVDCYPVADIGRFLDRSPNGPDVMNVGACIPKKKMEDFIDLAGLLPERHFRIYPIGYQRQRVLDYNRARGSPVEFAPLVEPQAMPAEYKRHQWLVYTASAAHNSVGWPLAIAEAQAAGVGVCMARLRPDLASYVGDAGILFDDIRELPTLLRDPVPAALRERGFAQAQKSDIRQHLQRLTALWPHA